MWTARCLAHECNHLVKVGVMRNPHRDLQPHALIVVRPVDHLMGDDVLVGNEELCAVAGFHGNIPGAKRGHPAISAADLDDVAGLDRFVEQQHHAAEQVGDRPLQTQPDADPECAGEQRKVDKSMPMLTSDRRTARLTRVVLSSFPSRTRARGVICETLVMRRSKEFGRQRGRPKQEWSATARPS